jgi:hypothetical protein
MDELITKFASLDISTNYRRIKPKAHHPSNVNIHINDMKVEQHKRAVLHSMIKYCYTYTIEEVLSKRRTKTDAESVLTDFFKGDKLPHPIVRDQHYLNALDITSDAFRPDSKVRPVHLLDIQERYPFKLNVNAEAPFSTHPTFLSALPPNTPPKFGNMYNTVFDYTRKWIHEIKDATASFDKYLFYMQLHVKTTIVDATDPEKLRSIWGVPKPWILAQIMFHWPLFACYRRNPKKYPLLWGYETFTGGWHRLNAELFRSHLQSSFIMIDWKSFDKDVPHEGIEDVHNITGTYIDFDSGYMPTRPYPLSKGWNPHKAARLRRLYAWTLHAYKHTPIVLPDGSEWIRQFSTLPSGLYTTQYYDSFWNYIMISTILLSLGFDPKHCIIKVLGDDSIIRLYVLIPPSAHAAFFAAMQQKATHYFGSTISVEKSTMTTSLNKCEILSYMNHNGLPIRSEISLLAKLYHTPARSPTPEKTMASAIGIAFANCGHSKIVYNVCKELHDYYARQGYTPNETGLKQVLGDDPFLGSHFSTSHFPSLYETKSLLYSTEYFNEISYNRFYPRDFFIADF